MNALPALLVLTDRHQARRPLPEVIAAAVGGGACAVVLREKDLPRAERAALAADIAPIVHAAGSLLVSAGEPLPGCDGVHLAAGQRLTPSAGTAIVGQSCHTRSEIEQAGGAASSVGAAPSAGASGTAPDHMSGSAAGGVDYATVSPVYATSSKPGYGPLLGLHGLAALTAVTELPVYALGGITTPDQASACLEAGATGVAVMGAVMRAADPASVVASLHTALTGAVA
jgi:thiamine-phosphate diphosphorylase